MDSRRWARGPLAGQRLGVELVSRTQGHRQEFTFCTEAEEGRKEEEMCLYVQQDLCELHNIKAPGGEWNPKEGMMATLKNERAWYTSGCLWFIANKPRHS